MKKQGFTLVELLVVIAIIGILSVIIIPSVINVNKNVNTRLLDSKKENITTAATLYASKNDDIFNGVDEVIVYVYELIDLGYVEIDVDKTDSRCTSATNEHDVKGCVLNPTSSGTLNFDYVILRKQGAAGYYAEYHFAGSEGEGATPVTSRTLVKAVCDAINSGSLIGKSDANHQCECIDKNTGDDYPFDTIRVKNSTTEVDACIISGENPNNYLRYGDSQPNWRVLGVYKLDGTLSAKIITSEPI